MNAYHYIKVIYNMKFNDKIHNLLGLRLNRETFNASLKELLKLNNYSSFARTEILIMFGATTLGVLWQPLTVSVIVFGVGFIFSSLFNIPSKEYIPFFAISLVLWQFLVANMNEFSSKFSRPGEYLNFPYPKLILYLISIISKNTFILILNLSVVLGTFIITGHKVSFLSWLFAIYGLFLYVLFIFGVGVVISILGSRFSDIPNIVQNFIQIMFYITPVMWTPNSINKNWVYEYNPLYYALSLVRDPLIYQSFSSLFYIISSCLILLIWIFALLFWSMFAWRINYHGK